MPELKWDKFDFFYCLEVEPQVEEYEISYFYEVRRDDLILELTVWPLESVVALSLRQSNSENLLAEFALFVHGNVRHINDKRGEYLEFEKCLMTPLRSSYLEADVIWQQTKPNWRVELLIKPHIQIRYLD